MRSPGGIGVAVCEMLRCNVGALVGQEAKSGFGNGFACYNCHSQFGAHAQLFVKFDEQGPLRPPRGGCLSLLSRSWNDHHPLLVEAYEDLGKPLRFIFGFQGYKNSAPHLQKCVTNWMSSTPGMNRLSRMPAMITTEGLTMLRNKYDWAKHSYLMVDAKSFGQRAEGLVTPLATVVKPKSPLQLFIRAILQLLMSKIPAQGTVTPIFQHYLSSPAQQWCVTPPRTLFGPIPR